MVCQECGFEMGGDSVPSGGGNLPERVPKAGSSGVVRDVISQKADPVRLAKMSQPAPVSARSYQEAKLEKTTSSDGEVTLLPDGSKKVSRRKKRKVKESNKPMIFLLLGWVCVVAIVFALFITKDRDETSTSEDDIDNVDFTGVRDQQFVAKHQEELTKLFNDYVFSPTMKGREQFIGRSSELALPFTRYYREHAFKIPASPIKVVGANVLEVSTEPINLAIELLWVDSSRELFGTVFYFDGQGWKLDWEAFAPYSEMSWSRFMSQIGAQEGEFRVLVRKRRSTDESQRFVLSFYRAPMFGESKREFLKSESPEVEVKTDTELGQRFLKLWNDHLEEIEPLDSILPKLDPEGFMRVTVKLAWEDMEGREDAKKLVLKELNGPGWFGGFIREKYLSEQSRKTKDPVVGDDLEITTKF